MEHISDLVTYRPSPEIGLFPKQMKSMNAYDLLIVFLRLSRLLGGYGNFVHNHFASTNK